MSFSGRIGGMKLLDNSVVNCLTCQYDTGQISKLFVQELTAEKAIIKQFNFHARHIGVIIVNIITINILIKRPPSNI